MAVKGPFLGTVLRFSLGNCTNGITAKETSIRVFPESVDINDAIAYCEEKGYDPFDVFIVETVRPGHKHEYKRAVHILKKYDGAYVAGGNYVKLDSMCTGIPYPIAVLDRHETWEEYDALSR